MDEPEVFDKEYVQGLRHEAGKYRQQVRELESQAAHYGKLEAQIAQVRVENELVRRGINADPSWIQVEEGMSTTDAVNDFLERWPNFNQAEPEEKTRTKVRAPSTLAPSQSNTNAPGPQAKGTLGDRSLAEIRKDPQARENLTHMYRDLLRQNSHISGE